MIKSLLRIVESLLYFGGLVIIFWLDWRYGIATLMMIYADTLKTYRMMWTDEKEREATVNSSPDKKEEFEKKERSLRYFIKKKFLNDISSK